MIEHPAMAEVAVIGVPDDRWGEAPLAFVVAVAGVAVDEAELLAYCHKQLAGFECPRSIEVIQALPRNPPGKALKKDLRAPYWAGRERRIV